MIKLRLTQEMIDAQIAEAEANADTINFTEPRAVSVSFDQDDSRIYINFSNGSNFSFLTSQVEELANLTPENLSEVALTSCGKGLTWESFDIDLSIQGLLLGIFGSRSWMREVTNIATGTEHIVGEAMKRPTEVYYRYPHKDQRISFSSGEEGEQSGYRQEGNRQGDQVI